MGRIEFITEDYVNVNLNDFKNISPQNRKFNMVFKYILLIIYYNLMFQITWQFHI